MAQRSEASRRSVLDGTLRLLLEGDLTVQQLSIEAIAREAGVGKTTIYRWWPSKAAVVIDAFTENHLVQTPMRTDLPVPEALEHHLRSLISQYAGPPGRLISQIIAESQYDPDIQALFREHFFEARYRAVVDLINRGIENGELPADIDPALFSEMLYAPVYLRLLLGHRPLKPKLARVLVAQALEHGSAAPQPKPKLAPRTKRRAATA